MNFVWAAQDLPFSVQPLCMTLALSSHTKGGEVSGKHLNSAKLSAVMYLKTSRSNNQVVFITLPNPWILTAYPEYLV